ncbi:MAG TPA: TrkA family potassium uptake protein [Candidatus Sulfomarinibacteraceae bacterium]|nr:TrkA family potassium uptake protein [Candidatus Sulfomarinibacteraceae bacterium]
MKLRKKQPAEYAIIGLGRFGASLARALMENGNSVLGIDNDPQLVQRISGELTHAAILDATDEAALREVDITSFETVIVAIGADFENNLLATVALKNLGIPHVISKAVTSRQREILTRVGADRVVQPEHDAGRRLAEELMAPSVLERVHLGPDFSAIELHAPRALTQQTLAQLDLRNRFGVTVLVIKRGDQLLVSPPGDTVLLRNDLLLVLGANDALQAFSEL